MNYRTALITNKNSERKSPVVLCFLLLLALLLQHGAGYATHLTGVELFWESRGPGKFQLYLVAYADCNAGFATPPTPEIFSNYSGYDSIPMNQISNKYIGHSGFDPNNLYCEACTTPFGPPPTTGNIDKRVFESAVLTLTGIPPAGGWVFYYGECCWIDVVNNISIPQSSMRTSVVIYGYNNQDVSTITDNAPVFPTPIVGFCYDTQQEFHNTVFEPDGDSVTYEWNHPMDETGVPLVYAAGYSSTSPLPSSIQNPANVAITLDNLTGKHTYYGNTVGHFLMSVKVSSYRCGQKISEVTRNQIITVTNACPSVNGGGDNYPPMIMEPFTNVGSLPSFTDTIYAGELVSFNVSAIDTQSFGVGNFQKVKTEWIAGDGMHAFQSGVLDCPFPPCPSILIGPTAYNTFSSSAWINWQTMPYHLNFQGDNCFKKEQVYTFLVRASDNYCGANASSEKEIRLVLIEDTITLDAPELQCVSVNPNNSVSIQWAPTASVDSLGLFQSYLIYGRRNPGVPMLIDSISGNINATSYQHDAADIMNQFGISVHDESLHYYIRTRSGYNGSELSMPSNIIKTMRPNVYDLATVIRIDCMFPGVPSSMPGFSDYVKIYREYPIGTWLLLDSVASGGNMIYYDTSGQDICNDTVTYRLDLNTSYGCTMQSTLMGLWVNDPNGWNPITPNPAYVCPGNPATLVASGGQTFLWSTGQTTPSISVSNSGTYTVTVTQSYGCSNEFTTNVIQSQPPVPIITGNQNFCAGTSTILSAGPGYDGYLWNSGSMGQNITITNPGIYTVTVTDSLGCDGVDTILVNQLPAPTINITGVLTFCPGQSSVITADPGFVNYLWNTGATTQSITVSSAGSYTVTVTGPNGCTGSTNALITFHPIPIPVITGDTTLCQGQSTNLDAGSGYTSYLWNTSATTQVISITGVSGPFSVTVTGNFGCVGSSMVTIDLSTLVPPNITGNTAICPGQSTILNAGSGYSSYLWNTSSQAQGINVSAGGTYTVTVSDVFNCTATNSLNVTSLPPPVATAIANGPTTFCQGDSVQLSVPSGFSSYQWHKNGNSITPPALLMNYYARTRGFYQCKITDANGCANFSSGIQVNVPCVPIGPVHQKEENSVIDTSDPYVEVFPNPSDDAFTIQLSPGFSPANTIADIYDASGRLVRKSLLFNVLGQLTIQDLPSGIYTLHVQSASINLYKKLVMVE